MITKLSSIILKYIYAHSDLSSDIKDIYQYGIEITLSSILNVVLVMGASLLLNDLIAGVLFLTIFIFVRSFTGGFHASTYFKCNFFMLLTFLLSWSISKVLFIYNCGFFFMLLLSLLNFIPIITFSPVPNVYKMLSNEAKKRNHILSIALSISVSTLGLFLVYLTMYYGYQIILTVSAISVMMIIEIIRGRRKSNEGKEDCCWHYCQNSY